MNLPKDPFMLLSVINTKLRDDYSSLSELCVSLGVDKTDLQRTLVDAGFTYMPEINQFR